MVGKTYLTTVEGSAPEELCPAVDLSATEPASRTPPTSTSSTNDQGEEHLCVLVLRTATAAVVALRLSMSGHLACWPSRALVLPDAWL